MKLIQIFKKSPAPPNRTLVEARSELINEVIARRTGFLEKWALLLIAGILLLLIAITWFIPSSDKIIIKLKFVGQNAPIEFRAPNDGKISEVFARDSKKVAAHETIAILESDANFDDIVWTYKSLDSAVKLSNRGALDSAANLFDKAVLNLGDLQDKYHIFRTAIISSLEKHSQPDFSEACFIFRSQIDNWKKRSAIESPNSGILHFTAEVNQNQLLHSGELLGFILPETNPDSAQITFPIDKQDMLHVGQNILLNINSLPQLKGEVLYISPIIVDKMITAYIKIYRDQISELQVSFDSKNGINYDGAITVKNERLFYKLFSFMSITH